MQTKGLFILNRYFEKTKFVEQYDMLSKLFKKRGVVLDIVFSDELFLADIRKYEFALFYDKDMILAKTLELKGIRVFNNSETLRICDDKALTYLELQGLDNINLIRSFTSPLSFYDALTIDTPFIKKVLKEVSFPFVIKATVGSYGNDVHLIHCQGCLKSSLKRLGTKQFVIQDYIESAKGIDYRVWFVGSEAVVVVKRMARNSDEFRSSISQGGTFIENVIIPNSVISSAISVAKTLKLDFGTVDFLHDSIKDKWYLCEVNTNAIFYYYETDVATKVVDYVLKGMKNEIR